MNEIMLYTRDALYNKLHNLPINDNETLLVYGKFENGRMEWFYFNDHLIDVKKHKTKLYQNNYGECYVKINGKNWYLNTQFC